MLEAIATDLDTFQSAADQDQKAKGKAPRRATETPRRGSRWTSGSQRLHDEPVVKRVPALRASVLRLWIEAFRSQTARI